MRRSRFHVSRLTSHVYASRFAAHVTEFVSHVSRLTSNILHLNLTSHVTRHTSHVTHTRHVSHLTFHVFTCLTWQVAASRYAAHVQMSVTTSCQHWSTSQGKVKMEIKMPFGAMKIDVRWSDRLQWFFIRSEEGSVFLERCNLLWGLKACDAATGACFTLGAWRFSACQWGPRPKSMSASLYKTMGAASLHKSMGAASLHKSMGAASLHKSIGAASLYKSMGAASLHKSIGAASLHKSWNGYCFPAVGTASCISQCISKQINDCCIPAEVNGCGFPVQVNGHCVSPQVNECCIPEPPRGTASCPSQCELLPCASHWVLHPRTNQQALHPCDTSKETVNSCGRGHKASLKAPGVNQACAIRKRLQMKRKQPDPASGSILRASCCLGAQHHVL